MREQLVAAELWADPHPLFRELRQDAPVWPVPGAQMFLVSSWELVAEAAGRVATFSNHFRYTLFTHDDGRLGAVHTGALGPDVFAGADPPSHTAHRRIFFPELVQRKIAALERDVAELARALLDPLVARGGGDLATELAHRLPLRVVAEHVIGCRAVDLDQLRSWAFGGSRLAGGMLTLDEMAKEATEVAGLATWATDQLDDALTRDSAADVLGGAAAAVRDGRLTREEAAFTLMILVGAGAETTSSLIGLTLALLAERPDLQDELRHDPTAVERFVEEVLRYDSPFRFHPRTVSQATHLGGVDIPEGALVLLVWASANRDEAVFDDPDELRLDRPNRHLHVGFGRGIHHCVGAPLARLEARVVVGELLERTASFSLDPSRPPTWSRSVWVRRHENLPVVIEPRR